MLFNCIIIILMSITSVLSYNNRMFTLFSIENISESQCGMVGVPIHDVKRLKVVKQDKVNNSAVGSTSQLSYSYSFVTIRYGTPEKRDPLKDFEKVFHQVLYGRKAGNEISQLKISADVDNLAHWPTGQVMRAETFQNKSSVHLPFFEYMHRGHCHLKITKDYMQTAVDAFAILASGDLADVRRLPPSYVLNSARTISMMKIAREKLAATWYVVKASRMAVTMTYETLEKFRPLFKYVNGREMARLNLSDNKILSYIGTHPDLNRHQVGLVASRYIQLNPYWTDAKYLNMMNNLLCGVPMIFMRRIPENTYLQLTHQIFYHIRACDPLQRRFYLAMMMRTQALGKSYSWSAREVSRLGLLLAEVSGPDLSAINPEAMSGITSQVMLEMRIHNLKYITEMQLRYIEPKPLNILARKLIAFQNKKISATSFGGKTFNYQVILLMLVICAIILVFISNRR